MMDSKTPIERSGESQWSNFWRLENLSATAAPRLIRHAGITAGAEVLDVACGTGVLALTAARSGARVTALDLTPALLARARENAALMKLDVGFHEGDVEALPFPDEKFDLVVSQFGHMFAPRPALATKEMLRVLKPGGTIAFATWPPDMAVGLVFSAIDRATPPPSPGFIAALQWGDPTVVRERLGSAVTHISFGRDALRFQWLSVQHYLRFTERELSPRLTKLFDELDRNDLSRAATLRAEIVEFAGRYFENNVLQQDYLLTRAMKV